VDGINPPSSLPFANGVPENLTFAPTVKTSAQNIVAASTLSGVCLRQDISFVVHAETSKPTKLSFAALLI
jgi:hypothetical protein